MKTGIVLVNKQFTTKLNGHLFILHDYEPRSLQKQPTVVLCNLSYRYIVILSHSMLRDMPGKI